MKFDTLNTVQIIAIIIAIWLLIKVTRKAFKVLLFLAIVGIAIYFFVDVGVIREYISKV